MWIFFHSLHLIACVFWYFLNIRNNGSQKGWADKFSYFTKKEHGLKREILPYPKRNLYNPSTAMDLIWMTVAVKELGNYFFRINPIKNKPGYVPWNLQMHISVSVFMRTCSTVLSFYNFLITHTLRKSGSPS